MKRDARTVHILPTFRKVNPQGWGKPAANGPAPSSLSALTRKEPSYIGAMSRELHGP